MSEIRFYHLQSQTQEQALPLLVSKAFEKGLRVVVKLRNAGEVNEMDTNLWAYDANSFLPHGSAKTGNAAAQPVWITCEDENPNDASVLIIGQGAQSSIHSDFTLCCEIFSGYDEVAVQEARKRWKEYKEQGFDITYWQQNERGGWDKKA